MSVIFPHIPHEKDSPYRTLFSTGEILEYVDEQGFIRLKRKMKLNDDTYKYDNIVIAVDGALFRRGSTSISAIGIWFGDGNTILGHRYSRSMFKQYVDGVPKWASMGARFDADSAALTVVYSIFESGELPTKTVVISRILFYFSVPIIWNAKLCSVRTTTAEFVASPTNNQQPRFSARQLANFLEYQTMTVLD